MDFSAWLSQLGFLQVAPAKVNVAHLEMWVAGLVGGAATIEDLARRTISNWICLAALLAGFLCQALAYGWWGLALALAGAAAGFGIFLMFYLLGGMGGGDVKLMAGFGAMLGASRLLEAAFWTALVGGVLAAVVLGIGLARRRLAGQAKAHNTGAATPAAGAAEENSTPVAAEPSRALPEAIPYAPAIVVGVWLTLFAGQ